MSNISLVKEKAATVKAWKVDQKYSGVHFKIDHYGISEVMGNFRDFNGVVRFSKETPEENYININIAAESIFTANKLRDKHLLSADFFDAAHYPYVNFEANRWVKEDGNNFLIPGILTIKGIQRQIELRAKYIGRITDLWKSSVEVFRVSGSFNRQDYNMNYTGRLDGDTCALANHVEINMLIQLKQQLL